MPFQFQGEEYSLETEGELDLADSKNKAVFLLKVTNAYLPMVGGVLRGAVMSGDYSLMPNLARANMAFETTMTGSNKLGLEYKKTDTGDKSTRALELSVNAPAMDIDYGFQGEVEIDKRFNIRIFANPSINQVHYPCQIAYQDNSNSNLDIAMQISITGLVQEGMGQADTMTIALGLIEKPEFVYTINAKMYGEDIIHQLGNFVDFYSATVTIANGNHQRGFAGSVSNESNEIAAAEAMVKSNNGLTETIFRYKLNQDSISIDHKSKDSTSGQTWQNDGTTVIQQSIPFLSDAGFNEQYTIVHNMRGSPERAQFGLELNPKDGLFVKLNGNFDLIKHLANIRVSQNLMPGTGFDMIGCKFVWDSKTRSLNMFISRNGDNGDKGQCRGKVEIKDASISFTLKMKDSVLDKFLPSNIKSKFSWNTENSVLLELRHDHNGKSVGNTNIKAKFMAELNKLIIESNVLTPKYKGEHNLNIVGSDFSSINNPASIVIKRRTKQSETNLDFSITISTDSAKKFNFKHDLKFGNKDLGAMLSYTNSGYDYEFIIQTKNNWDTTSFPSELKLSQTIHGQGRNGFTSTTRLENTLNRQTPMEYCQISLETTPNKNDASFKLTWKTDIPFVVQYMKTLEHLEAVGTATWKLPSPSAKFTLTAITTGEDAKISFDSMLASLYDFQMKLSADQAFNAFPLINVYAIEMSNKNFIHGSRTSETKLVITNDDVYTTEVESYTTSIILTSQDPDPNMPLFDNLPSKFTAQLKIPEYIFGEVIFNLLEVGYQLDIAGNSGSLTLTMDDKNADFQILVAEVSSYKIPKKFDIKYSHKNFPGEYGT